MNNLAKLLLLTIFALLAAANTRAQCQNYRIISRLGVVEDCTSGGVSSGQILALTPPARFCRSPLERPPESSALLPLPAPQAPRSWCWSATATSPSWWTMPA
jgi:hypothetical protein